MRDKYGSLWYLRNNPYGNSLLKSFSENKNEPKPFDQADERQRNNKVLKKKDFIHHLIKRYYKLTEGINDRQMKALLFLINNAELTNTLYQDVAKCNRRTASRDLTRLVELNILDKYCKGRGTYYMLTKNRNKPRKRDINGTISRQ